MTMIISAFPGTGKTEFYKKSLEYTSSEERRKPIVLDSDSSKFSWSEEGVRHPEWPNNYAKHIKCNYGVVDYILVSTHKEVRQALVDTDLPFFLAYPSISEKEEYLERYRKRGSPKAFIELMDINFEEFILELESQSGCTHLPISTKYLSNSLPMDVRKLGEVEGWDIIDNQLPDQILYTEAILKFGRKAQILKALSELTELSHALHRELERPSYSNKYSLYNFEVLDEIVDLETNIFPQLKRIFGDIGLNAHKSLKREKLKKYL